MAESPAIVQPGDDKAYGYLINVCKYLIWEEPVRMMEHVST